MGQKGNSIKAAIDIGSNTVLLLVGWTKSGKVDVFYEAQHAPRLGKGVDARQNLDPASISQVIKVLQEYKSILNEEFPHVDQVFVTATSAVRDAANKQYFLETVKQETGFSVQILSGEEEAGFTFFGARSVLNDITGATCVIDIGGGSTEIAIGEKHILTDRFSYDMGSVRFTERYLKQDPPLKEQLQACRSAIKDVLKEKIFHLPSHLKLIGVAGTVTSIAHISDGLTSYSPDLINGNVLSLENISHWITKFEKMTSEELLFQYPAILMGRADVFLGGLLILECFMKRLDISDIVVSTGGIRHGALLQNQ